jgi:hypothetical protein
MDFRKALAPLLALLLLGGVGAGIWYSNQGKQADDAQQAQIEANQARQASLRGMIGSEKEGFFADPRVQAILQEQGLTVQVDKVGSRAISERFDPKTYDFGFPSSSPSGKKLQLTAKASQSFTPFYTPIVFASWRPIAEILVANGVAKKTGEHYFVVDLPALLQLAADGKRWRDLKSSQAFATGKAVLPASTDVRSSSSAGLYLALASYVLNQQQVVQSAEDVERVMPQLAPLFLRQGFQESSSAGPFEDYLALGMGKAPLLVVYESQLVEFWLKNPARVKGDMVILYPTPTVFAKQVFVPFTPNGVRLGQLLETEPRLRELAQEYGYRTGGDVKGPERWAKTGIQVPEQLVDVVEPPSHEWMEAMIKAIEAKFQTP